MLVFEGDKDKVSILVFWLVVICGAPEEGTNPPTMEEVFSTRPLDRFSSFREVDGEATDAEGNLKDYFTREKLEEIEQMIAEL